jgi:hypothetical protein
MVEYSCTKGKDGRIYVFKINEKGRKVRTTNENVKYCKIKIPECTTLCRNGSPSKRVKTPCMKKKGLFANKPEVKEYCQHKPKGDYNRGDRQKLADIHNKVLRGEITESQGDKLIAKIQKPAKLKY